MWQLLLPAMALSLFQFLVADLSVYKSQELSSEYAVVIFLTKKNKEKKKKKKKKKRKEKKGKKIISYKSKRFINS